MLNLTVSVMGIHGERFAFDLATELHFMFFTRILRNLAHSQRYRFDMMSHLGHERWRSFRILKFKKFEEVEWEGTLFLIDLLFRKNLKLTAASSANVLTKEAVRRAYAEGSHLALPFLRAPVLSQCLSCPCSVAAWHDGAPISRAVGGSSVASVRAQLDARRTTS